MTTSAGTKRFPIFDGHNDVLLALHFPERGKGRTFFTRSEHGHIDLPRAREGGLAGGFFAVYIPAQPTQRGLPQYEAVYTEAGYATPLAQELEHAYAKDIAMSV